MIVISALATLEMVSLLERRRREGSLVANAVALLRADFEMHADTHYLVSPIDASALAEARMLVMKHPLRSLDAIHLATAIRVQVLLGESLTLVCGDSNVLTAAAAEGFTVGNPTDHP